MFYYVHKCGLMMKSPKLSIKIYSLNFYFFLEVVKKIICEKDMKAELRHQAVVQLLNSVITCLRAGIVIMKYGECAV